jgi:hypothetical protein
VGTHSHPRKVGSHSVANIASRDRKARTVVQSVSTDSLVQATIRIHATVNGVMRVVLVLAMVK